MAFMRINSSLCEDRRFPRPRNSLYFLKAWLAGYQLHLCIVISDLKALGRNVVRRGQISSNDRGGLAATPDDERNLGVEGGRQRSKKLLEV